MRLLRYLVIAAVAVPALLLVTLALPVPVWRTGELPAPPLPLVAGGPEVELARRVWIDTDAACGHGPTTDPDDCLALLLLAQAPGLELAGISTLFGNAPLPVTDATTRELARLLAAGPVHLGAAAPAAASTTPAVAALQAALAEGPLTILALGPLTNIAAALSLGLPITLVPYKAAHQVQLSAADLARFACAGAAWVGPDRKLWHFFPAPDALLVGLEQEVPRPAKVRARAVYCADLAPGLHEDLTATLAQGRNEAGA